MSAEGEIIETRSSSSEPATRDIIVSIPIDKVPSFMRRNKQNSDDYDPQVVSLGPYHHGKPELKFVEDFKPMALEMFISGSDKDENFFLGVILGQIDNIRSCYIEDLTNSYCDNAFARMMLLDACFVLHAIDMCTESTEFCISKVLLTSRHLSFAVFINAAMRDFFLLENQIPFWILKLLFISRYGEGRYQLDHILARYCSTSRFSDRAKEKIMETEPLHLLETLLRVLVFLEDDQDIQQVPRDFMFRCLDRWTKNVPNNSHTSRSGMFLKSECINFGCLDLFRKKEDKTMFHHQWVFRSVMELKSKGIHFRRSDNVSWKHAGFISHCFYAEILLPSLQVSKFTREHFQNLIAYENSPNTIKGVDMFFTSYINFMKALVTSPNDVKELREKKIIINRLGSDEEVVQVLRSLNTYVVVNSSIFDKIAKKIEEHYSSKAQTWIAELMNTYFRSPWSLITLVAATFLLFLSTAQTYYASPFHHSGKGS